MTDNKKRNISCILAARVNSTRLFAKALKPLASEESMLELIIKRIRSSNIIDDVILATTETSINYFYPILKKLNTKFYVGSEEDVLKRYIETSYWFEVDTIVRATGDNPLVSIKAMDKIIEHHIKTNAHLSHYEGLPYGSGVEVIEYKALKTSFDNSRDLFEREHITQYIYRHKDDFKIENPIVDKEFNMPELITTVDTKEQYEDVERIFKKYNNNIFVDVDTIIADLKKENEKSK